MLEQMRRNSRSFIIWILFGIIIAVFIISFGPQANVDSLACGVTKQSALEVAGQDVSLSSWRFAMNGLKGGGSSQAMMRRQQAVDFLVERELLAQAGEKLGFRLSDDAINQTIAAGEFYIMGHFFRMNDPAFWHSFEQLEQFAGNLGLTNVAQLAQEQRREQLAEMMRVALARSAKVSEEEARQYYVHQNTKITADYVKFDVRRYKAGLQLRDADIERYAAGHEAEVKKAWEAEKAQWASEKPRVLARQIFIAKDPPKPMGAMGPADAKSGAGKKEEAGGGEKSPALERAKAARARLASGADFATLAREFSEDRASRSRGGLLGWRPTDSLGQGKEVVEAAKKLAPGQLSDVIESERGYHILRIEERSEKGLTYEQKRTELAAKLAQDHFAAALARRDAEQALARAKDKPLEELFQRKEPQAAPGPGGEQLPPELLEQIEELRRQGIDLKTSPPPGAPEQEPGEDEAPPPEPATGGGAGDGKQGKLIVHEGPDVLARAGGAPPPPLPARSAQESDNAPPAGSEQLPEVTMEKPALETVGPVARMGDYLAGLGRSEKLVADLFENLPIGKVAPQVYELSDQGLGGQSFAVVQLRAREDADVAMFDKSRAEIMDELNYEKGIVRVAGWVRKRCEEVSKGGEIRVNRELFTEGEDQASGGPGYQPCATLSELSVAGQLRNRRADQIQ